ncbi:hypothetical protein GCM10027168_46340 [Streptomyces capparidis]
MRWRRAGTRSAAVVLALALLAGVGVLASWWEGLRAQVRARSWEPERPAGPERITPRMRAVRDAVTAEFGLTGGWGCHREDGGIAGGGEHPLGRACDYMVAPAGRRATGEGHRLGQRIASWVREHADEYGVWYVIYEQRIWSSRFPQRGNRLMEDRGSVTQNHYDHVHISVY